MRIQFLVTAHTDPALVARLCERLFDAPDAAVTVQWDCASGPLVLPPELAVDVRITQAPCEWGNGAQLDALLDSLRALASVPFDWLVVLSGQDYPIRPLSDLADTLANTSRRLFLDVEDDAVPPPGPPPTRLTYLQDRYFYHYYWFPQRWWSRLGSHAQRYIAAGLQRTIRVVSPRGALRVQRRPRGLSPAIGVSTRRRPLRLDRPCRKGSDWFALSRPVFDDLLDQMASSPELVQHFRRTSFPTESFFPTVLLPKWEAENAGHNLHYFRFVGNRPHPEFLREGDWDAFVASRAFFARKFDAEASTVLDRIDRQLLHA